MKSYLMYILEQKVCGGIKITCPRISIFIFLQEMA